MDISIASYSFHRLLESGKQNIFSYITDCKRLGCTLLDPWNGHLAALDTDPKTLWASPDEVRLTADEEEYVGRIKAAADAAGLPFGCLAADGAHIYEDDPAARRTNRAKAYRWITIAQRFGARQIRLDSGGTPELPDDMFNIIIEGYHDLLACTRRAGLELLMENHWGASRIPDNVVRILEAAPGLKLLLDTHNWAEGMQEEGWQKGARYTASVHIKTFVFDENGYEPTVDIPRAMFYLLDSGYGGCWGVESVPKDGDEYGAAEKTIALIRRVVNDYASKH
jgi:sugar phosphate isomerase/epimerase